MDGSMSQTQIKMGTFCTITLPKSQENKIQEGFALLDSLEHTLSTYNKDALLYRLNHDKLVKSDPVLKDILEKSILYHDTTHGYFDITIGSITKELYHFGEKEQIPSQEKLQEATLGVHKIILNDNTIMIDKNITLDLGGIGKGYAVDTLANYYHDSNISQGKIALSGDIRCLTPCNIEVQSPLNDTIFATLKAKVPNLSISTSGTYRRYVQKKEHHHLFNPKTKTQEKDIISLTLFTIANNTGIDAYATAISAMPIKEALSFLKEHKDLGYILVTSDFKTHQGNLDKFVTMKQLMNLEKEHKILQKTLKYTDTQKILMKITGTEASTPR